MKGHMLFILGQKEVVFPAPSIEAGLGGLGKFSF
jgi:hypothetical protein